MASKKTALGRGRAATNRRGIGGVGSAALPLCRKAAITLLCAAMVWSATPVPAAADPTTGAASGKAAPPAAQSLPENEDRTQTANDFDLSTLEDRPFDDDQSVADNENDAAHEASPAEGQAEGIAPNETAADLPASDQSLSSGISTASIFEGEDTGNHTFTPASVISFTLEYVYSNTGGLAGMMVASPQTVYAEVSKQADGTYAAEWTLPVVSGFRIVMDPAPLNAYLVSPPTGNETPEENEAKLERGDYNVNANNLDMPVFYSQLHPGVDLNPHYNNPYTDQYNQAWNEARTLTVPGETGYTAQAVCSHNDDSVHDWDVDAYGHGGNALSDPKIRITLTEEQLQNALAGSANLGTITVNYRRNAVSYDVNHWVPARLSGLSDAEIAAKKTCTVDGTDYVLLDQESIESRVGTLTQARAKTTGVYDILSPGTINQQIVEPGTVIDLYYHAISPVRVIFNTNYTYIPRQQVEVGGNVVFAGISSPTRTGYRFAGWQYLKKGAVASVQGEYRDEDYVGIGGTLDNPSLKVDNDLLSQAQVHNLDGMLILNLYPKWESVQTQVRVVFWTENLAGGNSDVQALASGGNTASYAAKYASYQGNVVTTEAELGQNNADHYSNAGSYTFDVLTGTKLTETDGDLLATIKREMAQKFEAAMTDDNDFDASPFFSLDKFEILEGAESAGADGDTAASNGSTTIYAYYTRNIYELVFHYYGQATDTNVNTLSSSYAVAIQTDGFSYAPGGASSFMAGGQLNFAYQNPDYTDNSSTAYLRNQWKVTATSAGTQASPNTSGADAMSAASMSVPRTITIRAKYGADLRDVWPVAQTGEHQATAAAVASNNGVPSDGQTLRMISWATTAGPYNQKARELAADASTRSQAEPTIMGTYGAMGSEIIADPSAPFSYSGSTGTAHHLVAYWNAQSVNYFTNNHCFELPGLDAAAIESVPGVIVAYIYDRDLASNQNRVYLVPKDNQAVSRYGFTDLMSVSWDGSAIGYDDPNGNYLAVRVYKGKCYAVARRVNTVSTNSIPRQNPSARLHMTRANSTPDHNTAFTAATEADTTYGRASNDINDPYQLYFYYDRDRYEIIYMVPTSAENAKVAEYELGRVELPYGALVTQDEYGFALDCTKLNTDYSHKWTPTTTAGYSGAVCPDRNANGTKTWAFAGWALGPTGANIQWEAQTRTKAADFPIQGNVRVYALWDAPVYTVKFDYAGGTEIGSDQTSLAQSIPANTRYSASGQIPRPVYEGHTLDNWYYANEDGTPSSTPFNFDAPVYEDQSVVAKWEGSSQAYSYTVYYVTKTLADPETAASFRTVAIDGEQWYVLDEVTHKSIPFSGSVDVNIASKPLSGYIPLQTNEVLNVTEARAEDDPYVVYVRYTTPEFVEHEVRYVLAGTEDGPDVKVVLSYAANASQVVTTPSSPDGKKLVGLGYELVSKQPDGTYRSAASGADTTWISPEGTVESTETLVGDNIPSTITYLVRPIAYTVAYSNAANSPVGADDALKRITAPAGTGPADSLGLNPTSYITTDSFTVANPASFVQDGKTYRFSHWSLSDGTRLAANEDGGPDFASLSVDPGTVGNLSFLANWVAEDPKDPQDPAGPNDPQDPQNPDNPNGSGDPDDPSAPGDGSEDSGSNSQDATKLPKPLGSSDGSGALGNTADSNREASSGFAGLMPLTGDAPATIALLSLAVLCALATMVLAQSKRRDARTVHRRTNR